MFDRLLVPIAADSPNRSVGTYALEIAAAFDADVLIASVLDSPQQRDQLRANQEDEANEMAQPVVRMFEDHGLRAEVEITDGEAEEQITGLIETRDIDLVVMGTHGRSGVDRMLLGSVAESVIRNSPVPVLAVTPDAAATVDVAGADHA